MKRLTLLLAVLAAVTALAATHQTKWESYADFDEFTGALSYGATTTLIEGGHATTLGVMCYKRDDVLNVDVSTEYTLRGRYASPRWNYQMNAPYLFDGRERGTAAFTVLDSRRGMRLAGPAAVKLAQKLATRGQLALRIDTLSNGSVPLRFDLAGAQDPIAKVLNACGEKTR